MNLNNSELFDRLSFDTSQVPSNSLPESLLYPTEPLNRVILTNLSILYAVFSLALGFTWLFSLPICSLPLVISAWSLTVLAFLLLWVCYNSSISTVNMGRAMFVAATLACFILQRTIEHNYGLQYFLLLATSFYTSVLYRPSWVFDLVLCWSCLLVYAIAGERTAISLLLSTVCGGHSTVCLIYNSKQYKEWTAQQLLQTKMIDLWRCLNNASADGIIILSSFAQICYINLTALSTFHKSYSELTGKPISVLAPELEKFEFEAKEESKCIQHPGKYHKDLYELIAHYLDSAEELGVIKSCVGDSGRVLSIFCNSFITMDGRYYLLAIRDITQMKEIQCSRAKTILLSSLSHELKTPLNGVIDTLKWFVQSMDNITKEGLKIAYTSSQLLHNYVSNVLDYADHTNGRRLSVRINNRTDIRKVVRKVRDLYKKQIEVCKVALSTLVEANVPAFLKIDRKRVAQILINILGIALRYTYDGGVFLRISCSSSTLKITLDDTGAGLPFSINPEKLFKTSQDVDSTFCDSGIHLAATQLIVEAMGGSMHVHTSEGSGTKVSISLPASAFEKFSRTQVLSTKTEQLKSETFSGKESKWTTEYIEEMKEETESCNFDATYIDEFPDRSCTVNSMASYIFPPQDFKSHVPVELAFRKSLETKETTKCECSKVLVVDDNALNLYVIQEILKKYGLKSDKATNGREAIKMLMDSEKCSVCHGYKIVFMDCNMPIMNGLETAFKMRKLMEGGQIKSAPIIGNSAFNEGECLSKCESAGMSAFCKFQLAKNKVVPKPLTTNSIGNILKRYGILSKEVVAQGSMGSQSERYKIKRIQDVYTSYHQYVKDSFWLTIHG
eukprot:TRINITY_DN1055_c6_g1_i1.p1 TRINITY_DN1055_c6_g1~~TRINITY_DN1055_c6_g1_i1.p1  ORF type:complete len:843 (+),score=23.53 TRINITY_DN1055_c6_g1_i1:226-2754(+)